MHAFLCRYRPRPYHRAFSRVDVDESLQRCLPCASLSSHHTRRRHNPPRLRHTHTSVYEHVSLDMPLLVPRYRGCSRAPLARSPSALLRVRASAAALTLRVSPSPAGLRPVLSGLRPPSTSHQHPRTGTLPDTLSGRTVLHHRPVAEPYLDSHTLRVVGHVKRGDIAARYLP